MFADKFLKYGSILFTKLLYINYILLLLLSLVFIIGLFLLYSAAGGSMEPWASKQLIRFIISIGIFGIVSIINIRFWLGSAYYIYFLSLILLVLVYFIGNTGMGAQRWLNLGFFNLQPSELVKFSIVLVIECSFILLAYF